MCEGEGGGRLHVRKRSCIKPALCFYRKELSEKFYDVIAAATSKKRILFKQNKSSILHLIFVTLYNVRGNGFSSGTLENKKIDSIVSDCFSRKSSS